MGQELLLVESEDDYDGKKESEFEIMSNEQEGKRIWDLSNDENQGL